MEFVRVGHPAGPGRPGAPEEAQGGTNRLAKNRWNLFGMGILQEGARGPQEGPKSAGQNRPNLFALGIQPGRAGRVPQRKPGGAQIGWPKIQKSMEFVRVGHPAGKGPGPQEGPKSAGQNRPNLFGSGIRSGRAGSGRAGSETSAELTTEPLRGNQFEIRMALRFIPEQKMF